MIATQYYIIGPHVYPKLSIVITYVRLSMFLSILKYLRMFFFMKLGYHKGTKHSGPRGGKSQKFDVLKSAYTKVSLKVDKISDTMQKKLAQ